MESEDLKQKISDFKNKHRKKVVRQNITSTKIVIELFAGVAVGLFIGYMLDNKLNTIPAFILVCTLFGFAGALWSIYKSIK